MIPNFHFSDSRSRSRSPRSREGSVEYKKSEDPIPKDMKLPPAIRGAVVARSLLAKPEALPSVIEQASNEATRIGVPGMPQSLDVQGSTEKKVRKSRWSTTKAFVPGMPTILPSDMDDTQRQAYLRKFLFFEKNVR